MRGVWYALPATDKLLVLALAVTLEAVTAVNGAIAARLERYLRGGAASVTNDFVHLPFAAIGVLAVAPGTTARGAAAWLVLEALVGEKLLFGGRKDKFSATVTAS